MREDPLVAEIRKFRAEHAEKYGHDNPSGEPGALLSPHPLYLALGQDKAGREEAFRALFRAALDEDPIGELRMALNQNQPIGNARFYAGIARSTQLNPFSA